MRPLFNLRNAQSCLLLIFALHLYSSLIRAQQVSAAKSAPDNCAQLVAEVEHEGEIEEVAISPDNRLVATADHHNNEVYLWDVETKKQLRRIEAFTKDLNGGIGFTKDGRFLVTIIGEEKGSRVQLWDTSTGQEAHHFSGQLL